MRLPPQPRPYKLINKIQHYAWGTRDQAAFIPQLIGMDPEPGLPYAELWIGAHPGAPSSIDLNEEPVPLDSLIDAWPLEILGEGVTRRFRGKLPFLFKVLSIAEPLSIQFHPDRSLAEKLHKEDPEHYPDNNHKPEIAVALDGLTLLAGCKPRQELPAIMSKYPEIAAFAEEELTSMLQRDEGYGTFHAAFLEKTGRRSGHYKRCVGTMGSRMQKTAGPCTDQERIFLDCLEKYGPDDNGLFLLFMMNWIELQPGEAIYLDACLPHAYVKGNIVECMANSDNVIRLGLTPKYKDARQISKFQGFQRDLLILRADEESGVYPAPVGEFTLRRLEFRACEKRSFTDLNGPAIALCTRGEVTVRWSGDESMKQDQGESVLIPASLSGFSIVTTKESEVFLVQVPEQQSTGA